MQLHRLTLTIVALSLFFTSAQASTNPVLDPINPTPTTALPSPLQATRPKLYREHIYAGHQLVTSVVYPDLQAANQNRPTRLLLEPETPIIAAVNNDPTNQRWLLMGNSGLHLIVLLMLAVAMTRLPQRGRRAGRRVGWRRRLIFGSLLLFISLSMLPIGLGLLTVSGSEARVVDVVPLARSVEPSPLKALRPVAAQSGLPLPVPGDPTWDQYQTELAQPKNDVGIMPHRPTEVANASTAINLASQNYSFTAPILQLAGRGVGVSLAAVYNSRVWSETGSFMNWDADEGFPAPGWRLDFGSISPSFVDQTTGQTAHLLIQPDGARRLLRQITGQPGQFQTVDSSFIQFDSSTRVLKTPNGQQIQYQQVTVGSTSRYVPTQIKDVNGNYLSIQYLPGSSRISQITDTIGFYTSLSPRSEREDRAQREAERNAG